MHLCMCLDGFVSRLPVTSFCRCLCLVCYCTPDIKTRVLVSFREVLLRGLITWIQLGSGVDWSAHFRSPLSVGPLSWERPRDYCWCSSSPPLSAPPAPQDSEDPTLAASPPRASRATAHSAETRGWDPWVHRTRSALCAGNLQWQSVTQVHEVTKDCSVFSSPQQGRCACARRDLPLSLSWCSRSTSREKAATGAGRTRPSLCFPSQPHWSGLLPVSTPRSHASRAERAELTASCPVPAKCDRFAECLNCTEHRAGRTEWLDERLNRGHS